MSLFSNAAFKATQGDAPFKYLSVLNAGGANQGYLEYSTEQVLSKDAKFALENASGGLVHIRSCSTNKYWVRSSTNGNWIVAQGVEPETDQESWICTLFQMDMDDDRKVTFRHVQSGNTTVRIPNDGSERKMFLSIDPAASTVAVSLAVDYDDFVVLPKYVAFKGSNELYYKNYSSDPGNESYAHFSVKDIGDERIVCEIQNTSDGNIRVRAAHQTTRDMFWVGSNEVESLIQWEPGVTTGVSQVFSVIRIRDNIIALRSLANNKICVRSDFEGSLSKKDRLVAKANGVVADAYLEVVETVFSRQVYSIEFDLDKSRIYGVELLYTDEHVWENPTDETQSGTKDGRIVTSKSKTFSNTINVSGTVTTSFKTGIPVLAEGKIEVSVTAGYTHQWDSTETEEQQVGHTFNVVVLPRKRTVARGTVARGSCDVPFAYVQKDFPANGGPPIISQLSDGVFTGANAYNFKSEIWYEDLPPQLLSSDQIKVYTRPATGPIPAGVTVVEAPAPVA